jgi:hypothetical protein
MNMLETIQLAADKKTEAVHNSNVKRPPETTDFEHLGTLLALKKSFLCLNTIVFDIVVLEHQPTPKSDCLYSQMT